LTATVDTQDGKSNYAGLAVTNWTGCFIKPRDPFDVTPFYRPTPRLGR